jgi:hypothetical protein
MTRHLDLAQAFAEAERRVDRLLAEERRVAAVDVVPSVPGSDEPPD